MVARAEGPGHDRIVLPVDGAVDHGETVHADLPGDVAVVALELECVAAAEQVGRGYDHRNHPRGRKDPLGPGFAVDRHGVQRMHDRVIPVIISKS